MRTTPLFQLPVPEDSDSLFISRDIQAMAFALDSIPRYDDIQNADDPSAPGQILSVLGSYSVAQKYLWFVTYTLRFMSTPTGQVLPAGQNVLNVIANPQFRPLVDTHFLAERKNYDADNALPLPMVIRANGTIEVLYSGLATARAVGNTAWRGSVTYLAQKTLWERVTD